MVLITYFACFCLSLPLVVGDLCVWEEIVSSWSTGYRSLLAISLEENASDWNVTLEFDTDVTFQAWKGDVTKLSTAIYSVTSKCYNNVLFACQCLELGYLVKHDGEIPSQPSIIFNGSPTPPCSESPSCNGAVLAVEYASSPISNIDTDPEHPCLGNPIPCHPDAVCQVVDEDAFNCTCPPSFIQTGVDLFDPTSAETACQVSSDTSLFNDTAGLGNETASVDELLNNLLANASALDTLLIQMAQFEESDLEEFISAVFNSTERTALLVAAVGDNPVSIMAVWDAIGNNTEAQEVYLEALGDLAAEIFVSPNGSASTEDPLLGFTLPDNFTFGGDLLGLLGNLSNSLGGIDLEGLGGLGK